MLINNLLKTVFVLSIFLFSCSIIVEDSDTSKSEENTTGLNEEITAYLKANYEGYTVLESFEFLNDNYSAYSLQIEKENIKESILVVLDLNENLEVVRVNNEIHFIDLSGDNSIELVNNDGSLAYTIESNPKRTKKDKNVFACKTSDCLFTQLSDYHFSCDCPDAVNVTITVGKNCDVTVESGK